MSEYEDKMVAAHKEGVRCAKDGTLQAAAEWACNIAYGTSHERTAFAAGYQGQVKREIAQRVRSNSVAMGRAR